MIALYILGVIVFWTAGWLIYGHFMDDPSGDGRIGMLFIAFIWLVLPYIFVTELFSKKERP